MTTVAIRMRWLMLFGGASWLLACVGGVGCGSSSPGSDPSGDAGQLPSTDAAAQASDAATPTTCTSPKTPCGGACVDTQVDDSNCGGCGTKCGAGQSCKGGTCTAQAPVDAGVDASLPSLFTGAGTEASPWIYSGTSASCDVIRSGAARSPANTAWSTSSGTGQDGVYQLTTSSGTFKVQCDMTSVGGGWSLVLNYLHRGTTNPALNFRSTAFPLVGSSTLGTDESANATTWGHAVPSLCKAITATSVRFYCKTANAQKTIHFTTSTSNVISYFQNGTGSMAGFTFTLQPDHTPNLLPVNYNSTYANGGDIAMTYAPFFIAATTHWDIRGEGTRWECGDFVSFEHDTLHRIWVR